MKVLLLVLVDGAGESPMDLVACKTMAIGTIKDVKTGLVDAWGAIGPRIVTAIG
jgi:hypothetical protein